MAKNKYLQRFVLMPLSKFYGMGVGFRNLLFKCHILKQREFDVPVIVVGNLAVGGTGKTPHTEYIVELLKNDYHLAVLSRGYKRKTKGFVLATSRSTPRDIGDEAFQVYQKYGREISVAVCENRSEGIEELLKIDPAINLIILDDAFQHRYVKPTVSIVLTEFNRPVFYDKLLPLGHLREPAKALRRADIVVVTKCPNPLKPIEYRIFDSKLDLYAYQKIYFSRFAYDELRPVFPEMVLSIPSLSWMTDRDGILVVTGIANPRPLVKHIKTFCKNVVPKVFPDHHFFTRKDIEAIVNRYEEMPGDRKLILTTEKDAVRLASNPYFPQRLKEVTFFQPVRVEFDINADSSFDYDLRKIIRDKLKR